MCVCVCEDTWWVKTERGGDLNIRSAVHKISPGFLGVGFRCGECNIVLLIGECKVLPRQAGPWSYANKRAGGVLKNEHSGWWVVESRLCALSLALWLGSLFTNHD